MLPVCQLFAVLVAAAVAADSDHLFLLQTRANYKISQNGTGDPDGYCSIWCDDTSVETVGWEVKCSWWECSQCSMCTWNRPTVFTTTQAPPESTAGPPNQKLRLVNVQETSRSWHLQGVQLFSDRSCGSKIDIAGAVKTGYTREYSATVRDESNDDKWMVSPFSVDKSFDEEVGGTTSQGGDSDYYYYYYYPQVTGVLDQRHGSVVNACQPYSCAFEVAFAAPTEVGCVKMYQLDVGTPNRYYTSEVSIQTGNGMGGWTSLTKCDGLNGNEWAECIVEEAEPTITPAPTSAGKCKPSCHKKNKSWKKLCKKAKCSGCPECADS